MSRAGLHTAGFYAAFFMAMGVHLPFWPLWLGDWGLTAPEIGLFAALGMGARVVGGLVIPTLADRMDVRRNTVIACTLVCMALFVAHSRRNAVSVRRDRYRFQCQGSRSSTLVMR